MFNKTGNYLFVPSPGKQSNGVLYALGEAEPPSGRDFVIIPYQNPAVKKIRPEFYPILSTVETELPHPGDPSSSPPITLTPRTTKKEYIQNVQKLKEQIQRGNIYEINYCIEFFADKALLDPVSVFSRLQALTRAPYAALAKTGDDFIICASPELFLKKEGGTLSSKPIKGTIRRGASEAEDKALKDQLQNSLKERTENVMAVDVARNDLSHIASRGSVRVNKLYNIETFETVHQMVSTVSCELKPGIGFERMIEATFPMASMTGAPKIRAMQLIDAFEDFERGTYSGAMGLTEANGDFTLSVIIRSIFYNQRTKRLSIAVGGAITYLCDPEKEYEECLLKAGALLKAINATLSES